MIFDCPLTGNRHLEELLWNIHKILPSHMMLTLSELWQNKSFQSQVKQAYIQEILEKAKFYCNNMMHFSISRSSNKLYEITKLYEVPQRLELDGVKKYFLDFDANYTISQYHNELNQTLTAQRVCKVFDQIESSFDDYQIDNIWNKHALGPHNKQFEPSLLKLEKAIRGSDISALELYQQQFSELTEAHLISFIFLSVNSQNENMADFLIKEHQKLLDAKEYIELLRLSTKKLPHLVNKLFEYRAKQLVTKTLISLFKLAISSNNLDLATKIFETRGDDFSVQELVIIFKLANENPNQTLATNIFDTKKRFFSKELIIELIQLQYKAIHQIAKSRDWDEYYYSAKTDLAHHLFLSAFVDGLFTPQYIRIILNSLVQNGAYSLLKKIIDPQFREIFNAETYSKIISDSIILISTKKYFLSKSLYNKYKSYIIGDDLVLVMNVFSSYQRDSLLVEDAYNIGHEKKIFSNDNYVQIIQAAFASGYPNLFQLGIKILAEQEALFTEDHVISLIATIINLGPQATFADHLKSRDFNKDFLNKLVSKITLKESESQKFEYLLEYLLKVSDQHYDRLNKKHAPQAFINFINNKIYSMDYESNVKFFNQLGQIVEQDVFVENKGRFFFQSTIESCFGPKSDLEAMDVNQLASPLVIAQNICDTKIKLKQWKAFGRSWIYFR